MAGAHRRETGTSRRQNQAGPAGASMLPKFDKKTIALVYDFDGTLSPKPMQEYAFLPKINTDPEAFWAESNRLAKEHAADPLITYMHLLYKKAKERKRSHRSRRPGRAGQACRALSRRRNLVRCHRRLRQGACAEPWCACCGTT